MTRVGSQRHRGKKTYNNTYKKENWKYIANIYWQYILSIYIANIVPIYINIKNKTEVSGVTMNS
jgi:hypothetical protein